MKIMAATAVTLVVLLAGNLGFCLEDTPANRKAQTERYMKATPPVEMLQEMTEKMAQQIPQEEREAFKLIMNKNLDTKVLTDAIYQAMVKHFNANELKALADFYGSPVGKSAMKKFPDYMADIMPVLQVELTKAIQKTNQQLNQGQ